MERKQLQFTLLQARNKGDVVRMEEARAFADRLGVEVDQIHPVDILTEDLHLDRLMERDAVLVGGSGEYSVCEPVPGVLRMIDLLVDVAAVLLNPLARVALTRQSRALRITPLSRLQAPRTSQLAASSQGGQSLAAPNDISS